jgi:predicted secreted protein
MVSLKLEMLKERLEDERSQKVVFVSHCLLNENVRYLGGAFRRGGVDEIIDDLQQHGVGIVQLPCPEQRTWGGVLKRRTILLYGSDATGLHYVRRPLTSLFVWYTRVSYARLARQVVRDIEDYVRSGFDVIGIIGIGGSPSCGVLSTLALAPALDAIAACNPETLTRAGYNAHTIADNVVAGRGLFLDAVIKRLKRRHLTIHCYEHDLVAEMHGEQGGVNLGARSQNPHA